MANREIVFIVYVKDIEESVTFYKNLLGVEADFASPRYVTFALAEDIYLALWTGHTESLENACTRTTEMCLNVPADQILRKYEEWKAKGVNVLREPYQEVFGTTFVVADLDGNLIRVAPID